MRVVEVSLTEHPRRVETTYMTVPTRRVWTSQNKGTAKLFYAPFEPNTYPRRQVI